MPLFHEENEKCYLINRSNKKISGKGYNQCLMPRSHSGEGATMISANIEEQRRFQIRQNSPKKSGKV